MPKFGKERRLLKPAEFEAVRERGLCVRSGPIAVALLPGERSRLGIAASRRIGNAVTRNRIKRVLREHFRSNEGSFPKGDCVVIPRSGISSLGNGEIRERFSRAIEALSERMDRIGS